MGQHWYYLRDKQRVGPISAADLKRLTSTGQLSPTDLVWTEGIASWVTANKVKGLFAVQPAGTSATTAVVPSRGSAPVSSGVGKAFFFGLLGALGCLAGWLIGEGFLWMAMPASKNVGSLASKPVLPPPPSQSSPPLPPPSAMPAGLAAKQAQAPKAPPPPELSAGGSRPVTTPAPPPPEFAQRLEKAGAKSGDVQITLIWFNVNDLDLHCTEPGGEHIFFAHRRSRTGGELDVDMNAGFGLTDRPVENIYWPKGQAPQGKFQVFVHHYANHGGQDPTEYKVSVLVGGVRNEYSGSISTRQPMRKICEFEVNPDTFDSKEPDLRLGVSRHLIVNQEGKNNLKVRIARGNLVGPVVCSLDGDLQGITAPAVGLAAHETETALEIAAAGSATPGIRSLTVRASAGKAKADASFQLMVQALPPDLQLAVSPELVVYQGGSNRLQVRLARCNIPGPVQVRLAGDLRDIEPQEFSLGAGANDAALEIQAAASAPVGKRTLTVLAAANGVETMTNLQFSVKAVPPRLQMTIPDEIRVNQGGHNQLPVRIVRDRITGPVRIRLEGDMKGISPGEFTIPADCAEDEVTLSTTDAAPGKHTLRVTANCGEVRTEEDLGVMVIAATSAGQAWSWWLVLVIGMWTALLALGLSLALVMGQNWYLARPWLSWSELAIVSVGSLAAGVVAGGVGQALYGLLTQLRLVPEIGFLAGWLLLGSLLGRGVVFFIPNLNAARAMAAGSCGGFLGAGAFLGVSVIGNVAGRFTGAAILGFAIGLMVALVETACRKIWLEVVDGPGKVRTVNLGATPVFIGGDSNKCTLLVAGAPGKSLKFWEKDGQIFCLDIVAEKTYPVSPGYRHPLKQSEVVVCANDKRAHAVSSPPTRTSKKSC